MNIYRHAFASSVTVALQLEADQLVLEIRDNGVGVDGVYGPITRAAVIAHKRCKHGVRDTHRLARARQHLLRGFQVGALQMALHQIVAVKALPDRPSLPLTREYMYDTMH